MRSKPDTNQARALNIQTVNQSCFTFTEQVGNRGMATQNIISMGPNVLQCLPSLQVLSNCQGYSQSFNVSWIYSKGQAVY